MGSNESAPAALTPGSTILVFGDAWAKGNGSPAGEDWPRHLAKITRMHLVNGSDETATAIDSLANLEMMLQRDQPKVVLIALGVIDLGQNQSMRNVERALAVLAKTASASGARVAIISEPIPAPMSAIRPELARAQIGVEAAKSSGALYMSSAYLPLRSESNDGPAIPHARASAYESVAWLVHDEMVQVGWLNPRTTK